MAKNNPRLAFSRRRSRPVPVGAATIGGTAPILIQSMCTTPTQDIAATVAQTLRLAEAGCELVRITAPGPQDAQALAAIRQAVTAAGFGDLPLCADIHFMPAAALEAIEHVEKVRINPGNYADKKRFQVASYDDQTYAAELERVAERFRPLVRRAKELGRTLRIGTNHGSLSDRIVNRYGDTPAGMCASALEFIDVCCAEGFYNLVISMKASNPRVMVQAYRLLVAQLNARAEAWPLHLGVTEAGGGEDGRSKSAAGIGCLLEDGIGDTIRVSLTEDPEAEIPVARQLVARYAARVAHPAPPAAPADPVDPFRYQRRRAEIIRLPLAGQPRGLPVGGGRLPIVIAEPSAGTPPADCRPAEAALHLLTLPASDPVAAITRALAQLPATALVGLADCGSLSPVRAYRLLNACIEDRFAAAEASQTGSGRRWPIVLSLGWECDPLAAAADAGGLLIDGIGDALYLPALSDPRGQAFTILQAVRARLTRTDFVACPSCGRTLFDLQEVTAHIKTATGHLDGVVIAIMGCIVNGPGEMADADYGYVGSGPGKITLYRGQEAVARNIPAAQARNRLIELIKADGKWRESPQTQQA